MKQAKISALLATFSPAALQRFRKHLQSPAFNENPDLLKLFEVLVQEVIPGPEPGMGKEEAWKAVFGPVPYDDQALRKLNSELMRQALAFLAYEQFRAEPFSETTSVLPSLLPPSLGKHFNGVLRQFELIRNREPSHTPTAYYHQFLVERARHLQLEASGSRPDTLGFLESADYYLDCFYFAQKLKHWCDALSYQNSLALEARLQEVPGLASWLRDSPYAETPLIKAYLLVLDLLRQPEEEEAFGELSALLQSGQKHFSLQERRDLFIHLMNYCIDTKINRGRMDYFDYLFRLYKIALEQAIILDEGVLDPFHYKNIITVGLRIDAFDWTEQFIRDYTPALPPSQQANALTYNLAKVFFQQKKYEKVIEQLREVEYQDLVYALGAKLMLLKTYYELGEYQALDSLSDSFRVFLQRHKRISREVKQQYLNVLRFVRKLSNLPPRDRAALEKVRRQIEACKALADKGWVLEKIKELE
jgi:hypothetical protein